MQIRPIGPQDTPRVQAFIAGILDREFSDDRRAYAGTDLEDPVRYYGGGKDLFLVAEKDGVIIGTVAIKEDGPNAALLRRIFVSPAFRGQGYGDLLLRRALAFCFDRRYQTVTFRGSDRMQAALKLCLKEGFRETDAATFGGVTLRVLTKRLGPPA